MLGKLKKYLLLKVGSSSICSQDVRYTLIVFKTYFCHVFITTIKIMTSFKKISYIVINTNKNISKWKKVGCKYLNRKSHPFLLKYYALTLIINSISGTSTSPFSSIPFSVTSAIFLIITITSKGTQNNNYNLRYKLTSLSTKTNWSYDLIHSL